MTLPHPKITAVSHKSTLPSVKSRVSQSIAKYRKQTDRKPDSQVENHEFGMSQLGTFELTHPELMSEVELRTILKNRSIDFSKYETLCRSQLIEVYKKVALPLPQRGNDLHGKSEPRCDQDSTDSSEDKSSSVNRACNLKRNFGEISKASESTDIKKSKLPDNEAKVSPRKISVDNARSNSECNGTEKRMSDGRDEETVGKKRQKITWP